MGPAVGYGRVQAARAEREPGYYINILRVRSSGVLSRHRHSGPVHAFTLRGRWRYLEHDRIATPGGLRIRAARRDAYSRRSGGRQGDGYILSRHRRVHLCRSLRRGALGYEDVFTKLEHAIKHYEAVGFGGDFMPEDRPMTRRETVDGRRRPDQLSHRR